MKQIPLTKGHFAIVDDADYDWLSRFKWHFERGYACRKTREKVYMHKLINGTPKGMHTDHINGDGLDNRRDNLRSTTAAQNCMNSKKIKIGSSKYKGVSFFKRDQNWAAKIMLNRKGIHLGYFDREEDAAQAYNFAARKYFGEFAKINIAGG